MLSHMALPTLIVCRAAFSIEEPWAVPDGCKSVALRRSTDGATPRLSTDVFVYCEPTHLNVLYRAQDDGVVATHLQRDAPLYEEDVVEAFLAPSTELVRYYEIEVNPLGTTFDALVESPEGVRRSMRIDLKWECAGLFAAVRCVPDKTEIVMRIPFASLDFAAPKPGAEWRGNFFRIDRSPRGDEFTAWQPTMKNPPDFHVVAAFGRIVFA